MNTRRTFIRTTGGIAILLGTGGLTTLIDACSTDKLKYSVEGNTIKVVKSTLQPGHYALIKTDNAPASIYLISVEETYYALLLKCTHKGCTEFTTTDTQIVCGCHGGTFNMKGDVLKGPPQRPLDHYPVTTDADYVYITLNS